MTPTSEDDLLGAIIDLARYGGWMIHHGRPARTNSGWRTPIQGDIGFPDLVLAHPRHGIVFAELKSRTGRLTTAQWAWADILDAAARLAGDAVHVYTWRPADWPDIVAIITPGASIA